MKTGRRIVVVGEHDKNKITQYDKIKCEVVSMHEANELKEGDIVVKEDIILTTLYALPIQVNKIAMPDFKQKPQGHRRPWKYHK